MDFLSNREMAIALWVIAIFIYISLSTKMGGVRKSFNRVITALFARQVILVFILMSIYVGVVVYFMFRAGLWNIGQIKNTIFWAVAVGFMSLVKLDSIKKDKSFFRKSVFENIKILAIIQFLVNFYVFSLWIELLLVPVLVIILVMSAIAELDEKLNQAKKFLDGVILFFGLLLIFYAAYMILNNFNDFAKRNTLYDFFVPPLLTLFYLPFIFLMMVYSIYEQVFIRLIFIIRDKRIRFVAKTYAILFFNFRLSRLERWINHISRREISSHEDLVKSFLYICKVKNQESSVSQVPFEEGWSPYIAKDFLFANGLKTGYYDIFYENEWQAISSMMEIGGGIIPDNMAYYVEGNESVAKKLKIKLNINDSIRSQYSREKLLELVETLLQKSLGMKITEFMRNALLAGKSHCEKYGSKSISVSIDFWHGHKFNGHEINFIIASN